MLSRPTNKSKYVLYNKSTIPNSVSAYHHPSCEECREGRRSIDVNYTSQLETFIYLLGSGSGSVSGIPDSHFLIFHTPVFKGHSCSDVRLHSTKSAVVIVAVYLGLSTSSLRGFVGVDIPFNKLTSVLLASVLLLIMNFVIY